MNHLVQELPKLSKRKLRTIAGDQEKTAAAAHLTYVTDKDPGLERRKEGGSLPIIIRTKRSPMMRSCFA